MDGQQVVTIIIGTRDHPAQALRCVRDLARCIAHAGSGPTLDVIVADAGRTHAVMPAQVGGLRIRVVPVRGAGTVNAWMSAARAFPGESAWTMLLSDRARLDAGDVEAGCVLECLRGLDAWDADVVGVCPLITKHGAITGGSLPEVLSGSAAIVRTDALRVAAGFATRWCRRTLSAALLAGGGRIAYDPRIVVRVASVAHRSARERRAARLSKLAAWRRFVRSFAPGGDGVIGLGLRERSSVDVCACEHKESRERIVRGLRRSVDVAEGAAALWRVRGASRLQRRTPLSREVWDRLTGANAVEHGALAELRALGARRVALAHEGSGAATIARVLRDGGIELVELHARPDAIVIGTLNPGAMVERTARMLAGVGRHGTPVLMAWTPPTPPELETRVAPEEVAEGAVKRGVATPARAA